MKLLYLILLQFFIITNSIAGVLILKIDNQILQPLDEYLRCPSLLLVYAKKYKILNIHNKNINLYENCSIQAYNFVLSEGTEKDGKIFFTIKSTVINLKFDISYDKKNGNIESSTNNPIVKKIISDLLLNKFNIEFDERKQYYKDQIKNLSNQISNYGVKENQDPLLFLLYKEIYLNNIKIESMQNDKSFFELTIKNLFFNLRLINDEIHIQELFKFIIIMLIIIVILIGNKKH